MIIGKNTTIHPIFRNFVLAVCSVVLLVILGFPGKILAGNSQEISEQAKPMTVLASSSLTNVMVELARLYSVESKSTVSVRLDSPEELSLAVELGQPADLYITEHTTRIQDFKQQGLIDVQTISILAGNELVLVTPKGGYLEKALSPKESIDQLLRNINERTLLTMGDPATTAVGYFARQSIEQMGYWEMLEPFIVRTASTRAALYLIAEGASAGVLYKTDALSDPSVAIVSTFPVSSHDPILYRAAVVASEQMETARDFLKFLKSDAAQAVFAKHGFSPVH